MTDNPPHNIHNACACIGPIGDAELCPCAMEKDRVQKGLSRNDRPAGKWKMPDPHGAKPAKGTYSHDR